MAVESTAAPAYFPPSGRGVRVVEGAGLENRYTGNGIVGSNPTLSVGGWQEQAAGRLGYPDYAKLRCWDSQHRSFAFPTI